MTAVLARLRRRLSFANVTSGVALFVALGGTSYAAIALPANSVDSEQIRTGAVGGPEIRTDGVGNWEVRSNSIGADELRKRSVGKPEIETGGVGAAELHTDSVRGKEIRNGAVHTDEIDKDAVTGEKVKDGSLGMAELDDATRSAIAAGAFHVSANANGAAVAGNAQSVGKAETGKYVVTFGSDVSKCTAVATLGQVDAANAGTVTVEPGSTANTIVVKTFKPAAKPQDPNAQTDPTPVPADEPFHVIVAC